MLYKYTSTSIEDVTCTWLPVFYIPDSVHVIQSTLLASGLHAWERLTEIIEHLHIMYIILYLMINIYWIQIISNK